MNNFVRLVWVIFFFWVTACGGTNTVYGNLGFSFCVGSQNDTFSEVFENVDPQLAEAELIDLFNERGLSVQKTKNISINHHCPSDHKLIMRDAEHIYSGRFSDANDRRVFVFGFSAEGKLIGYTVNYWL